jgi:hypothetical protein
MEQVSSAIALEIHMRAFLDWMSEQTREYVEASDALKRLAATAKVHETALQIRLKQIAGREGYRESSQALPVERPGTLPPISSTLQNIYALLSRAMFGYAILHVMAHRFYDSQEDGNTADLAERHLNDYAKVSQEINRIVSDAVVWDLGKAGQECQCQCPSCGLGVCLCSPHGTNTVDQILHETTQGDKQEHRPGIRVRPPRKGSPAVRAGLQPDDTVLAIDGQEVSESNLGAMQGAIRKHGPGEQVRLYVKRGSGETQEVLVTRS